MKSGNINRAVGRFCVVAVFMQLTQQMIVNFVRFAELLNPLRRGGAVERVKKRAEEANDANAMRNLGCLYYDGSVGLPQDDNKAMDLWHRSGELGCARSYRNIAISYGCGQGVERDEKKAKHYYELAAMGGDVEARHNIGKFEAKAGNMNRALKHWMISAGSGDDESLTGIRLLYMDGNATKDDFEKALRAHKESKDDMESDQRDEAAAILRRRTGAANE